MAELKNRLEELGVTTQKAGRVLICEKGNVWMRIYKDDDRYFVLDFVHDYYSHEPIEYIIDVFKEA